VPAGGNNVRLTNIAKCLVMAALGLGLVGLQQSVSAQSAPAVSSTPPGPYGMPLQEWQGLSCLWGGTVAGSGVFYYSDVLAVAATGATNPLLLIPLIATGFVAGCSVGANAAPGLTWIARQF
jgi:hypothetical protein